MSTPSVARQRVLDTAARLFYAEGIHTVGVDRIVTEAEVTRATFYRHFPSKEELVRAYIQSWDAGIRAEVAAGRGSNLTPAQLLALLVERLGQEMCGPGFRGCPFINAAAEYPDPGHPVSRAIAEHRTWLRGLIVQLMEEAGLSEPQRRTDVLIMLRDGAMVGAALGDPATVAASLAEAVSQLLAA
ncbi:TetR/AcrR family transcriptional regulator [Kitasatospora kifunensis]|uniref:AcrR family transcriptional regulator n=1 Tax=Kitasatospora kifunensis TaxID=58351 RepID=A0A7W7R023_KITKI|nr:TetR/AcrR family transcriptional regulator [Kitasatospora kifunensis]MBB4922673.1 AcrR family transcriptional regulator [Kitasatospora kifunensis]